MSLLSALGAGLIPALKTGAGTPSVALPAGVSRVSFEQPNGAFGAANPGQAAVFSAPVGVSAADRANVAAARQMFPEMTDINDLIAAGRRLNAGGGQQQPAPTAPAAAPTGFGPTDSRLLHALGGG